MKRTTTPSLKRRTRAMLASFAQSARELSDACERASKGKATPSDQQLIRAAWDAAGRGISPYLSRGLAVQQTAETGVHSDAWAYMMEFFGVELVEMVLVEEKS